MILGLYTIANPVQIQSAPFTVMAGNLTLGGIKAQKVTRTWDSDVFAAGQPIRGFRFRITWGNLSHAEAKELRDAHTAARVGYVRLSAKDLGVTFDGAADEWYVIADPQSPVLAINWSQGYAEGDETPVVYDAEAHFLGATFWDD